MTRALRRVGDRGLLLELRDNAAVHRVAAAARRRHGDVLEDVVAGHGTVLLTWPEPPVDVAVAEDVLSAAGAAGGTAPGDTVVIPVVYDGPDLEEVARRARTSPEEVARRHAAGRYTVAFTGFAPGFGYLLGLDPSLHLPRRDEPRERVLAGSVAVAGEYSAVYPSASPGGWHLIGRTPERMFDARRDPPALLAPGMHVVFEVRR